MKLYYPGGFCMMVVDLDTDPCNDDAAIESRSVIIPSVEVQGTLDIAASIKNAIEAMLVEAPELEYTKPVRVMFDFS